MNSIMRNLLNFKSVARVGILNYFILLGLISYYFLTSKILKLNKKYFFIDHRGSQILVDSNFSDLATYIEIFSFNEYGKFLNLFDFDKSYNIIDLGSNIGLFYKFITLEGIKIKNYVGIEPNIENFKALNFNTFPMNGEVINKAVWLDNKGVRFSNNRHSNANSISENGEIIVPSITLSEITSKLPEGSVALKMDIEGAEYEIIKNSKELFDKFEIIFVEFHNVKSIKELQDFVINYLPNYEYEFEKKFDDLYLLNGKKI
jgi:FkbM family methyltransferase